MTCIHDQIKTAYEVSAMTPQEIAEDQELDITAVKAALMQCSSKYRKDCGLEEEKKDDLNFSDDQLRDVTQALYQLGMSTDDEHLKFKCLTYIRDDKKGRRETVRQMAGNTYNILQLNQQIQEARRVANEVKKQLVDV